MLFSIVISIIQLEHFQSGRTDKKSHVYACEL